MRGKRRLGFPPQAAARITPAHAGKTRLCASFDKAIADHPRACGENRHPVLKFLRKLGSPPRMRGKPVTSCEKTMAQRITPAHAGKTETHDDAVGTAADHPRACGENTSEMAYFRG